MICCLTSNVVLPHVESQTPACKTPISRLSSPPARFGAELHPHSNGVVRESAARGKRRSIIVVRWEQ